MTNDSLPLWNPNQPAIGMLESPDIGVLLREGQAAQTEKNWPLAISLWEKVREAAPENVAGYAMAGEALLAAGRLPEAETVIAQGVGRFPEHLGLLTSYGWAAHRQRDWAAAVARWENLRRAAPKSPAGYLSGSSSLMAAGRFGDAEALLLEAEAQFPVNIDVKINLGWVANRSKKWRDAETRWRTLHEERPDNDQICTGFAETLLAIRRFDEARPLIEKSREKRPNDPYNIVIEARIAIAQGRWADAISSLTAAQANHPNDNGIRMILNEASMRSLLEQNDEDGAVSQPVAAAAVTVPSGLVTPLDRVSRLRDIFGSFESLGSTCEFGLVQRHFGAEPLGLLRWSLVTFSQLIDALQNEFKGVGDPQNTKLKIVNREWYTEDVNFGLGMHTFILEDEEPAERLFPKVCKRLQFLRRKLISDLQDAVKPFVYKSETILTDTEVLEMFLELQKYGKNKLLVVMLASEGQRPGTIREIQDGLIIGYVAKYFDPKPEIAPWLHVSLKAHALFLANEDY